MAIVFYGAPFSSALPVACALNELAVAHERINVVLGSDALRKPEFLALNPNAKVPTLVVDGTPMFEALAIVQWLGDRYGVAKGLWPAADAPARMTALAWTTWAYVTFGAHLQRFGYAANERAPAELRSRAHAEHAQRELQQLLGVLDARLASQPYMLGKDYSLVDLLLANVVRYASIVGVAYDSHAHIGPWLERCHARPALRSEWGQ
jgi:glutathione S-transferase